MRLPNISVSENVTNTIRSLDMQRYELDRQISSGQKLSQPEDDGMRIGKLIRVDAQKNQLAQYQRNASYASEFLNAGHLNLDNLRELNLRAQEISRVAGSNLNESAGETYGFEVNQLIEEALNRVNASHRGRALFSGTEYKPNFGNSQVKLGQEYKKIISLNNNLVGEESGDGTRRISAGEQVIFKVNGREYVVDAKVDGITTTQIIELVRDLINQDTKFLSDSPEFDTAEYTASVRGGAPPNNQRNEQATLYAKVSDNGELEIHGTVGESYRASVDYVTKWDPSLYFPEQTQAKLDAKANSLFSGLNFDELTPSEKDQVRDEVFSMGTPVYSLTSAQVDDLTGSTGGLAGDYILTDNGSEILLEPAEQSGNAWRKTPDTLDSSILDAAQFPTFDSVSQYLLDNAVIAVGETPTADWEREIPVSSEFSDGSSKLVVQHSDPWKRLNTYELGAIAEFDGKLWQSQIDDNVNHKPSGVDTYYWKEVPSGYDVEREDWSIKAESVDNRFYFMAPDGRFFDVEQDAISYTASMLINSFTKDYSSTDELEADIQAMVKEVTYPVTRFEVNGSESKGTVTFDTKTLDYRLAAAGGGADVIDGLFLKGTISRLTDPVINEGSVVIHEGRYYLTTEAQPLAGFDGNAWKNLTLEQRSGDGAFLLGDSLPVEGREIVFESNLPFSAEKGEYVYDRPNDKFYVATTNVTNATSVNGTDFKEVGALSSVQGAEWSSNFIYDKGQIALYEGKYYQCQRDNFNNVLESGEFLGTAMVVRPDDEYIINENNLKVANDIWLPLQGQMDHVMKFSPERDDAPSVTIQSAGSSGIDASAKAVVDAHGRIVGLKVMNPGRYFFGTDSTGTVPPDFEKAKVLLENGQELEATILWEENPSDPGPFRIAGFDISDEPVATGAPSGPRLGDTFDFATGSKAFLDHRDSEGNLLSVTYMGGKQNSQTFVGKDTAISYMLDSSGDKTKELGDIVNSLVQLRDGLSNSSPNLYSQEIADAEQGLISMEDNLINKMGELSAKMVRMETVRAHDEDYLLQLDQQISRDLDVDLSEAIMRLTRVSTAYQAAMQVGAQLLNTSLLNYL